MIDINILILAGGQGTRMGSNKALLSYDNEHRHIDILIKTLKNLDIQPYISCQKQQAETYAGNNIIIDNSCNEGPLSGIISAFKAFKSPWMTIPCDMPFVNNACIIHLLTNRQKTKDISLFKDNGSINPLLAIWEVSGLDTAQIAFNNGERSPYRIIQSMLSHKIEPNNSHWLFNVNTKNDWKKAKELIETNDIYG